MSDSEFRIRFVLICTVLGPNELMLQQETSGYVLLVGVPISLYVHQELWT